MSDIKKEHSSLSDKSSNFRLTPQHMIIYLIMFTEIIGFAIVYPILPYIGFDLGLNELEIGFIGSIFSFCQLFASPITGKLSDRFGRRPLLIFSQISTLMGFVLLGFAGKIWILVTARIIDGLFGSNMTVCQAALSDITAHENRTTVYSYSSGIFGAGLIVGPLIGGLLSTINYSVPMFVAAGISFLSIILVIFFIPETNNSQTTTLSIKFNEILPIKETKKYIKDNRTRKTLFLFFLYSFSFMLFINNFTLYVENKYQVGPDIASYYRTWIGILRVILQLFLMKSLLKKMGETKGFLTGAISLLICMVGLIFSWNYFIAFIPMIFLAYGTGMARPILTSRLTKSVKQSESATILGISNALNSLGQILTPIIGGAVLLHLNPNFLPLLSAIGFIFTIYMSTARNGEKNEKTLL
ncbi:Multidrug resistance protein MdtG [Candidatus Lokiarchaeum ossiferum]|uniref:Multidrug resistance protein MdtG n=1 Tax=Candidatus Lokiarchaeum ossiferum TaxID=2951803 RepID=A0ABY6HW06_9ARCH|nr:Multidrug resistance protein MdtG [Candidatus Lokiarchaeum sp. B-35]